MSGIHVQPRRIKKNKRGSDRHVDGVTLRETEVGASVHNARAVRMQMSKEDVVAANVCNASTIALLRIQICACGFVTLMV